MKRFYVVTRDLHLYLGLFLSPFVLVFAISVFFLVHAFVPGVSPGLKGSERTATGLPVPPNLVSLAARERVDALRVVLRAARVYGEIGFVSYFPKQNRMATTVTVPGREAKFSLDLASGTATIEERETGVWDALITLHKLPGPHLVGLRGNWLPIQIWRWLADATVYLLLFISLSGVYLWYVLRAERRVGLLLLGAGAVSFWGLVYALCR
ncbi:MAG: PepSY-associated TM helix domain-containing protein [Acidobacteria bacterium]|nr:PepSY-associated TM helix domain-containing protein [Acidobacteriota bacterium]